VTRAFRHHNPYFPGDADSLSEAMAENARQNPDKVLEVKHVVEEDELVVVHGRVRLQPDSVDIALVHIFRFEGNHIAELWDISHPMPANSPNQYGMF
jgi:predicted SnoaL-like aldol condensation-catalyzing enzyme